MKEVKVRIQFQGSGLKENEVAVQGNIRVIIAQFVLGCVRKRKKGQVENRSRVLEDYKKSRGDELV